MSSEEFVNMEETAENEIILEKKGSLFAPALVIAGVLLVGTLVWILL